MAPNVKAQLAAFNIARLQKEKAELEECLRVCRSESEVQRFIADHNHILSFTFAPLGRPTVCLSQYRLGAEHIPDFVLLYNTSHSVRPVFLELKLPNERIFTERGTASESLREAGRQVGDWYTWLSSNWDYFQRGIYQATEMYPSSLWRENGTAINLHFTSLQIIEFKIIMGRRAELRLHDNQRRLAQFALAHGTIEIVTYDRLIDAYEYVIQILEGRLEQTMYGHEKVPRPDSA